MIGFAAPARLVWLLGVAAWAAALWWRSRRDRALLARIGDERLLRPLMDPAVSRGRWQQACRVAALVLLVVAAARPQWGTKLTEIRRRGNDVLIAVDLSASMLAEDVPPTRMAKAKRSLGLLVQSLHGDRVGIIAFGGEAFLQCPLTLDVEAAAMFLDALDVGTVPVAGTALGAPVRRALANFSKGSTTKKILVLLTDGEDTRNSDPLGAARDAKAAGVVINTIGLGTPQGDVIKLRDASGAVTSFKKDEKGETVLSRMDEATLMEMARLTGGIYVRGQPDDSEVATLVAGVSSFAQQTLSTQTYRVREDRFQGFLLLAILLLIADWLIARRGDQWRALAAELRNKRWEVAWPRLRWPRRAPAALACLLCLGSAERAGADWKAQLRLGNRWMQEGNAEEARQQYLQAQSEAPEQPEPPYNVGNSYLYEGKFDDALKAYDQAGLLARSPMLKSILAYNRGWALARAEREPEAIAAFKEALRWNPKDEDARFNLEFLRSPKHPKKKKPGDGKGQPQQGKPKPGELSKEDAERVLEMVRDQEKRMREEQKQQRKKEPKPGGEKDW